MALEVAFQKPCSLNTAIVTYLGTQFIYVYPFLTIEAENKIQILLLNLQTLL